MTLIDNNLSFFPPSTKTLLTSCRPSILPPSPLWLRIPSLFIGFWLRHSCFLKKKIPESMWGIFLYHYFSFVTPKFSYKIFLESSCCQFFFNLFFRNLDIRWRSYELFYLSNLRIHALLFLSLKTASIFIHSSSFLLWFLWYLNHSYWALFLGILASNIFATMISQYGSSDWLLFKNHIYVTWVSPLIWKLNIVLYIIIV